MLAYIKAMLKMGIEMIKNSNFGALESNVSLLTDFLMLSTSKTDYKLITAGFQALSDPLRLQILELLQEQELCVCELRDRVAVAQSKLSFHLKILREANLARSRQEGRWVYYSLNPEQLLLLEQYLNQLRENALMRPAHQCLD